MDQSGLIKVVKELLSSQRLAVLSTQGEGHDGILVKTEEPYFESALEIMSDLNAELTRELYQ